MSFIILELNIVHGISFLFIVYSLILIKQRFLGIIYESLYYCTSSIFSVNIVSISELITGYFERQLVFNGNIIS